MVRLVEVIGFTWLIMASVHFCLLCALLGLPISQGKEDGHPLAIPQIVKMDKGEDDTNNFGVWKMNIEWRYNFSNNIKPEKVAYDMEIFHTEQMTLVHQETIEMKTNLRSTYQWSWTSPIPLQCTSHSVRLRFRDHNRTSDWTPLYTLNGEDRQVSNKNKIYPQSPVVLVNNSVIFCCILTPRRIENFSSEIFTFRISNHTYASKPIPYLNLSPSHGFDITCNGAGSTVFTGYAPDIKKFICETRDLSSVECHWSLRRETGFSYPVRSIQYSINGRNCSGTDVCSEICTCVLADGIDKGVVNWTLTAKNALGQMIISDVADPKHRVRLKAPVLDDLIEVHARYATLKLKWDKTLKYSSFPMTCQVEVNGYIVKGTFNGTSLRPLVLADLQPFTKYTVQVRCGSLEHFYEWGDWSNPRTFYTKEDIPEPVDVWAQALDGQICVMWNELTMNQSHGIITEYELILRSSVDSHIKTITKSANNNCHIFSPGIADGHHFISVSAKNSVGVSPPSNITIPSRWSDFEKGKIYTVYGWTSGVAELLQRREGYVEELPPSECVKNLTAAQQASAEITLVIDQQTDQIISSVVASLVASAFVLITITVFCYRKREWLKSALYPDIPKPRLSEAWLIEVPKCHVFDKMLIAESEVLMITKPDPYPQVMPEVPKAAELISLNSQDTPQPENYKNTQEPQNVPSLITNLSYIRVPCSAIENPIYTLAMSLPTEDIPESHYRPQMQDASDQIQPCEVKSVGYQPQSVATSTSLVVDSMSFEYLLHSKI